MIAIKFNLDKTFTVVFIGMACLGLPLAVNFGKRIKLSALIF
jgi:hypothetical protein